MIGLKNTGLSPAMLHALVDKINKKNRVQNFQKKTFWFLFGFGRPGPGAEASVALAPKHFLKSFLYYTMVTTMVLYLVV